jgi:geranylgeranyl transferase type-2 subunit beta
MIAYLDLLDEMLHAGLEGLGAGFRQAQLDYVLARQQGSGGFAGRRGEADLYYTEFALRALALLDGPREAFARAHPFLSSHPPPRELVDVFSLLNARRILVQWGFELDVDLAACRDEIDSRRSHRGGYGRADGRGPTAYATFLAGLNLGLLGEDIADAEDAARAIAALQQPDGGFAQERGGVSHTNSTAAAVTFLLMAEALTGPQGASAATFLIERQSGTGGFTAYPDQAEADLLSTFTALATLSFLDGLDQVDVPSVARFTRGCADAGGGFCASPDDAETDVEYTYYGLGTLALLAGMTAP